MPRIELEYPSGHTVSITVTRADAYSIRRFLDHRGDKIINVPDSANNWRIYDISVDRCYEGVPVQEASGRQMMIMEDDE